MTPERLLSTAIAPALAYLRNYSINDTIAARRMMLTIAFQESGLRHRRQVAQDGTESGAACGWWQCEKTGAAHYLLLHKSAGVILRKACTDFNVEPTDQGIWDAIRYNDILAAIVARLNLFVLPDMLPEVAELGWQQYINAWRPGRPILATWALNWNVADRVVKANP